MRLLTSIRVNDGTLYYDDNVKKSVAYEYVITAYSDDDAVLAVMTAATG